jgi:hypothetical protein
MLQETGDIIRNYRGDRLAIARDANALTTILNPVEEIGKVLS